MNELKCTTADCRDCNFGSLDLPRCVGFGPLEAEVAVVGINPSHRAKDGVRGAFIAPFLARMRSRGRPFSAIKLVGSERAFAALVDGAGLDLSRVYSTNVVKCATPGNREPTDREVRTCVGRYLRTELEALPNLRAVLVFGRIAGGALGLSGFGSTATIEGTIAEGILLRHPVATLRRWTRLSTESRTISEFLTRFAPTSIRGDFEPARP